MRVSKWRLYLPYILSIVILAVLGIYLYRNADRYQQLFNLSAGSLFLLVGLTLAFIWANGATNYLLYRAAGASVNLAEGIGLAVVSTLSNYLPFMGGGLIAKSVYLKQVHELAYTRFLGATVALFVCSVAMSGVIGTVVLVYLAFVKGIVVPIPLILIFLAMVATILLIWLPFDVSIVPGKWGRRLVQLMQGWQLLSQNRLLLTQLMGLNLLQTFIFAGRLWVAFHILSQDVTLAECILLYSATILTHLINITPGGLGFREAIIAGVAVMLGFEAEVSIVAVSIDRLISILLVIALGIVYTHVLGKQMFKLSRSVPVTGVVHEHSNETVTK